MKVPIHAHVHTHLNGDPLLESFILLGDGCGHGCGQGTENTTGFLGEEGSTSLQLVQHTRQWWTHLDSLDEVPDLLCPEQPPGEKPTCHGRHLGIGVLGQEGERESLHTFLMSKHFVLSSS